MGAARIQQLVLDPAELTGSESQAQMQEQQSGAPGTQPNWERRWKGSSCSLQRGGPEKPVSELGWLWWTPAVRGQPPGWREEMNGGLIGFRKPRVDLASGVAGCRKQRHAGTLVSCVDGHRFPDLSFHQAGAGELTHCFKWKLIPDLITSGPDQGLPPPPGPAALHRQVGSPQARGRGVSQVVSRKADQVLAVVLGLKPSSRSAC